MKRIKLGCSKSARLNTNQSFHEQVCGSNYFWHVAGCMPEKMKTNISVLKKMQQKCFRE